MLVATRWFVVLAIFLLAGVAVLAALRARARYLDERNALDRLRTNLRTAVEEESTRSAEVAAGGSAPAITVEPAVLAQGVRPGTLVAARLDTLEKLGRFRVRVASPVLRSLALDQAAARPDAGLLRFSSATMLLLGIFGTVLSLPGSGYPGSRISLFPVSIGVLFAATGISAEHLLAGRHASFLAQFERFTVEELLPVTAPDRDDESLLQQVSLQLEESAIQLAGVIDHNRDAIEELTGAQAAFAAMVEQIRSLVVSDARQDLGRVIEQLDKVNASTLGLIEHLPSITTAIEASSHGFKQRFDSLMKRWFLTAAGLGTLLLWLACRAHG